MNLLCWEQHTSNMHVQLCCVGQLIAHTPVDNKERKSFSTPTEQLFGHC